MSFDGIYFHICIEIYYKNYFKNIEIDVNHWEYKMLTEDNEDPQNNL